MQPLPGSGCRFVLLCGLLIKSKFSVEFFNTPAGVYQLLFACIEWVALGADFNSDILLCASRLNNLSASAFYRSFLIIGMYTFLHDAHLHNVRVQLYHK